MESTEHRSYFSEEKQEISLYKKVWIADPDEIWKAVDVIEEGSNKITVEIEGKEVELDWSQTHPYDSTHGENLDVFFENF